MLQNSPAVLATEAAQTLGAAIAAILLFSFYRQYGKSYLAQWTASWAALSTFQLAAAAGMWLAMFAKVPPFGYRRRPYAQRVRPPSKHTSLFPA